jgi:hypothetical protein
MSAKSRVQAAWEIKIDQWRASGLGAMDWCRTNGIPYQTFHYWRKKLGNKPSLSHDKAASQSPHFVELVESSKNTTGIEIQYQGFILRLSKDFDSTTFQRCIQLLRNF